MIKLITLPAQIAAKKAVNHVKTSVDNVKDADAALRLRCDPATVRRNRRRLVRRLALRLYGVDCI